MTAVPVPPVTLFQLLSVFRDQLDGIVSELTALNGSCPRDANKQLRDLHEQIRGAIYHLELTLDFLIPLEEQSDADHLLPGSDEGRP